MVWVELSIDVAREDEEAVAELLRPFAYGDVVVEEGYIAVPWENDARPPALFVTVKAYFPEEGHDAEKEAALERVVRRLERLSPLGPVRRRTLREEEWTEAWKAHFTPLPVGERLLVVPAWATTPAHETRVPIVLDPGLAFGTGQHPSTRLALVLLERHLHPEDRVLDWGTGSGILAIAAALLGAFKVLALDIDPIAVKAAKENAQRNHVEERVIVREGGLERAPGAELPPPYDVVLANITYAVLSEGLPTLWPLLAPGGRLVCSGLLRWTRDQLAREAEALGAQVVERLDEGEWGAAAFVKPRSTAR